MSKTKNKLAIVTGCTGQTGSYFIEYLLTNTDLDILGIVRHHSKPDYSNISSSRNNSRVVFTKGDITDPCSIEQIIKNYEPDYFVNFAALAFVADSWLYPVQTTTTNTLGPLYILEAIRNFAPNCRFFNAGSSEQFGDVIYSPQDEKHPMRPRSPYGASKCSASLFVKTYRESYGLYAVQGISFNHESPRRSTCYVTKKITSNICRIFHEIEKGSPIKTFELGNLDAKRDWSHAKDMAKGAWIMLNQEESLEKKLSKKFNVSFSLKSKEKFIPMEYVLSSGEEHSVREFLELCFNKAGLEIKKTPELLKDKNKDYCEYQVKDKNGKWNDAVVISKRYFRPAEVNTLLGDSSQIKADLGWEPEISFEQLVDEMIKFDMEEQKRI